MTVTIGQVSLDYLYEIRHDGDRLTFATDVEPDTLAAAKVVRQNLLGLVDNDDQPVVPLTWSEDDSFDGFYRVVAVDVEPATLYLINGFMRAVVSLERVTGGYANPFVEVVTQNADRSNFAAGGGDEPINPLLFTPESWSITSSGARTTASGDVAIGNPHNQPAGSLGGMFRASPDDFYDGACIIESTADGTTWNTVVGEQVAAVTTSARIRIGNGLVRMTMASTGIITAEVFNDPSWEDIGTFQVALASSTVSTPVAPPTIQRNAPNLCSLTYVLDGLYSTALTVSVRRGQLFISCAWTITDGDVGTTETWHVQNEAADTAVVVNHATSGNNSGAIRRSANNGDGHRWVLGTDNANAVRDVTGTPELEQTTGTAVAPVSFFIGVELDGSSATVDALAVRNEWYAFVAEEQTVVSP